MASGGSVHFLIQELDTRANNKVELLLIKEKLWDVIKCEKPEPVTAWSQKDDEARATDWFVGGRQLQHIRNVKSARDAWDALKGYYQKVTLTSKVLLLKQSLLCRTVIEETGDMKEHITTITVILKSWQLLVKTILWQPCYLVVFHNRMKLL